MMIGHVHTVRDNSTTLHSVIYYPQSETSCLHICRLDAVRLELICGLCPVWIKDYGLLPEVTWFSVTRGSNTHRGPGGGPARFNVRTALVDAGTLFRCLTASLFSKSAECFSLTDWRRNILQSHVWKQKSSSGFCRVFPPADWLPGATCIKLCVFRCTNLPPSSWNRMHMHKLSDRPHNWL